MTQGSPAAGPSPRRILLVEINEDGTVGGSHQALFDLVGMLDRKRYHPVVMFYEPSEFVTRLRQTGVEVLVWQQERALERRKDGGLPGRIGRSIGRVARRARLLRQLGIDLVHINNSPAVTWSDWLPAARLAGVPIISHVRGYPLPPVEPGLARWACAKFDRLLAISEFIVQELRDRKMREPLVRLVPDGVNAAAVRQRVHRTVSEVRGELGAEPGAVLAVMAGHLRRWKGQDVVLEALGQLPLALRRRLRLVFAGADDPYSPGYRERLEQLVADHDLAGQVRFLGPRRDVPDLMHAADVVVHASTTAEPFGLVVVEALALGRPVVASALGGPGRIVVPAVGWTFDPARPEELVAVFREILEDPSGLERRRSEAPHRAELFGLDRTLAAVTSVYDEMLGQ